MNAVFDYLIIGAGAAGSVLANRLSADPRVSVALLEAGDDVVAHGIPPDVQSVFPLSAFNPRYMWPDTRVHWRTAQDSPAVPLQQGRNVGGSSSIMGMWALRGMPGDYDEWRDRGAEGWGWDNVLSWFRKLEHDIDFDGPMPERSSSAGVRSAPAVTIVWRARIGNKEPSSRNTNAPTTCLRSTSSRRTSVCERIVRLVRRRVASSR